MAKRVNESRFVFRMNVGFDVIDLIFKVYWLRDFYYCLRVFYKLSIITCDDAKVNFLEKLVRSGKNLNCSV